MRNFVIKMMQRFKVLVVYPYQVDTFDSFFFKVKQHSSEYIERNSTFNLLKGQGKILNPFLIKGFGLS